MKSRTTLRTAILTFSLCCNFLVVLFLIRQYYYRHRMSLDKSISYAYNRQTVFKLLPVKDSDIVFAGDSHTQFFIFDEFFPGRKIKNRGIVEDNTLGLLNRANQFLEGHPQKIFLEIGVNDLWDNIPPDTVVGRIDATIRLIKKKSPHSKILVNSLFPSSAKRGADIKLLIPEVNRKLKSLCDQERTQFIDCYGEFSDQGALSSQYDCGDGIHLNGNGYKKWSEIVSKFL